MFAAICQLKEISGDARSLGSIAGRPKFSDRDGCSAIVSMAKYTKQLSERPSSFLSLHYFVALYPAPFLQPSRGFCALIAESTLLNYNCCPKHVYGNPKQYRIFRFVQ